MATQAKGELRAYRVKQLGDSEDYCVIYNARSRSQAKYLYWLYTLEANDPYREYLPYLHARVAGAGCYPTSEEFRRNAKYRNIEFAYCGMRVMQGGKMGTIVGHNSSANLDVLLDEWNTPSNCHPWWDITYFNKSGGIIRRYIQGDRDRSVEPQAQQAATA